MLTRKQFLLPVFLTLAFLSFFEIAYASPTYLKAKKIIKQLFIENPTTLYCGCVYNLNNSINLSSCHMESAASVKRAQRLEIEHMMPAENFGRHLSCWREKICKSGDKFIKGRKCCEKSDAHFNLMEGELYNLWPVVGLVNQTRSNYRYAALENKKTFFGCEFTVDVKARKVEPADKAKGIVARANLFMAEQYQIPLSSSQEQLFKAWDKQFPPQPWEKKWALRVASIEGYSNHFITDWS